MTPEDLITRLFPPATSSPLQSALDAAVAAADVASAHLMQAFEQAGSSSAALDGTDELDDEVFDVLLAVAAAMKTCGDAGQAALGPGPFAAARATVHVAQMAHWTLLLAAAALLVVQDRARALDGPEGSRFGDIAAALARTMQSTAAGQGRAPAAGADDCNAQLLRQRQQRIKFSTTVLERAHALRHLLADARRMAGANADDDTARLDCLATIRLTKAAITSLLHDLRQIDDDDARALRTLHETAGLQQSAPAREGVSAQVDHMARRLQTLISARCIPALRQQPGRKAAQVQGALISLQFNLQITASTIAQQRDTPAARPGHAA